MSKIKIKKFGPIKEGFTGEDSNEWMDIKKVTVFIGTQGSGKSTVAKLISTLTWIEKVLVRGDYEETEFTDGNKFMERCCAYHRLENYFKGSDGVDNTEIEYEGNAYHLTYKNGKFYVKKRNEPDFYFHPQIMYVPAERNFISTINNARLIKLSSDPLVDFLTEFDNAKREIKESVALPINKIKVEYNDLDDIVSISGDNYKVKLTEASSGFQSLIPLFLVSRYLAYSVKKQRDNSSHSNRDQWSLLKNKLTDLIRKNKINEEDLSTLYTSFFQLNKSIFINIVEEPEQNLFPSSQRQMLNSLIDFTNLNEGSELILTTHSPYIINYLTLAVKANSVLNKINNASNKDELQNKLNEIVPLDSVLSPEDLVIYELDDQGKIIKLGDYKGLPSDENYLNDKLEESNQLFTELIAIEESCQ
ncbi:AAA ATPase domain-containing protein [Chitinophaga sp. YR573]|uniref:AAA family ATPase n=1 Tax=Chitinophaga sp. YR573 TaxID=1881040 RepID=UPI0008C1E379|nr:AAA family ATPase [Chitinophaga sp. YR573]SEW20463.1 AAA ATPase domain-containing protein [Chitinophaga sp. YR573]